VKTLTRVVPHIRWMIRRDMPEVVDIERAAFPNPWVEDDFLRCLRQRNCIGMVAERDDRLIGFTLYELHKDRVHVLNFAVAPEWRRRGVGSNMVAKLKDKLSSHRRGTLSLNISDANLSAQLFLRCHGFRAVSVLRGYYPDTGDDAYRMEFAVGATP